MSIKLNSPSAERNKIPLWSVLESKVVPTLHHCGHDARILEIAAGAGIHTQFFAKQLFLAQQRGNTTFTWYPTDMDKSCMASTQAYVLDEFTLNNIVMPPIKLTLNEDGIVEKETLKFLASLSFDLIININMIHISPWEATLGLMKVAGEKLRSGGLLFLYGPYKVGGTCVESNRCV